MGKLARFSLLAMLVLIAGGSLAACGKKAGHLYAPEGAEDNGYPHTYPDPATDAKPPASP